MRSSVESLTVGVLLLWEEFVTGISSRLLKDSRSASTRVLRSSRLTASCPVDCGPEGLERRNRLIRYRPHHRPRNFIDVIH